MHFTILSREEIISPSSLSCKTHANIVTPCTESQEVKVSPNSENKITFLTDPFSMGSKLKKKKKNTAYISSPYLYLLYLHQKGILI